MRYVLSFILALTVPVLVLTGSLVGAPKKANDKDMDKTTEKQIKLGQIVGKVEAVYEAKKTLRLTITYQVPKLNQSAVNGYAQAQLQAQQALAKRPPDYNAYRTATAQMAQHQANLYTVETKTQPMEIGTTDEVMVRAAKPPEQFDDKGKIKKLTKKELEEAKGDPKLPGYKAEFSDIQVESIVQVTLVKKKDAPKVPLKGGKKDKDAEAELLGDNMPQASSILILRDPPMTGK